jgi:glutathione S-transferase
MSVMLRGWAALPASAITAAAMSTATAARAGRPRALPFSLRRDAFRIQQSALSAADEPQGSASRLQGLGRRPSDIDRIAAIWRDCLASSKGPFLFGERPCLADAMFAPVCTRFVTYDVKLDRSGADYCNTIMNMPAMKEWIASAMTEPDELEELDVEF